MAKPLPKHPAALYFNELAPLSGTSERCALFGYLYHSPDPDQPLVRVVVALPAGGWGVVHDADVPDVTCGGVYREDDGVRQLFGLFRGGDSYVYSGTSRVVVPRPRGAFLMGVRRVGSSIYACGTAGSVFRMDGRKWREIGARGNRGEGRGCLNALDGFDERDLYAVGDDGRVAHFDGSGWRAVHVPTTAHLHQVVCHDDGMVYVCGRDGTLFRGRGQRWFDLSSAGCGEDLWGLAAFQGHVYACTYRSLFRVETSGPRALDVPTSTQTFYRLAANDAYLWASTGTGVIKRYDGSTWMELLWPDSA